MANGGRGHGHVVPMGRGASAFGQGVGSSSADLPVGVQHAQNNRPDQAGAPPPQVGAPESIAQQLDVLLSNARIAADRLVGLPPNSVKAKTLESLFANFTTIQENIGSTYAQLQTAQNPVRLLQVQKDTDTIARQVGSFIQTVEQYVSKYGTAAFAKPAGVGSLGAATASTMTWLWWTLGAVVLAGAGYYFYARKKTRRVGKLHEV